MNRQYGLKLRDAKAPVWVYGPWETQQQVYDALPATLPIAASDSTIFVTPDAVQAICGPNNPSAFQDMFS